MELLIGLLIAFLVTPLLVVIVYTPFVWLLDGARHLEDHIGTWYWTRHSARCQGCKRCLLDLV
jgi:hypothetical protein